MCCRTLLDPAARKVLKPTLLEMCRQSFKQLLDKEKAAQAKQVRGTHLRLLFGVHLAFAFMSRDYFYVTQHKAAQDV